MNFLNTVKKSFTKNSRIYLDYASLTPVDPRVINEICKYSGTVYANPSSWYKEGVNAKKALDEARKDVADFLGAHSDEIIFTSGGTEGNNIALQGIIKTFLEKRPGNVKPHIIVSAIEHSSILVTVEELEKEGCEVTKIAVDKNGVVIVEEIKKAIQANTVLVSIMTVNNEIGSIQPIRDIAKIIRQAKASLSTELGGSARHYPIFHTDAAQAGLFLNLNVDQMGVDLLTLDAGKVYGPRGVGALYIRRNLFSKTLAEEDIVNQLVKPIVFGGGQERGIRSGTENIPGICGFAKALLLVRKEIEIERNRISGLRETFINGIKKIRPDITINGCEDSNSNKISPHIVNISIPDIDNEFFVMQLDAKGIACSTKSSCLRDVDESYVLNAIGADSHASIRFSFGRWTTMADINKVLRCISSILSKRQEVLA
jgi:cysteine desulfurase